MEATARGRGLSRHLPSHPHWRQGSGVGELVLQCKFVEMLSGVLCAALWEVCAPQGCFCGMFVVWEWYVSVLCGAGLVCVVVCCVFWWYVVFVVFFFFSKAVLE